MSPLDFIRTHAGIFARCGSVVASYRSKNGRRCGPYYRLAYRADRRQRSLYLGTSEELAAQVRSLLAELQARRDYYRLVAQSERRRRENLLHLKRQWQQAALAHGYTPAAGNSAAGAPRASPGSVFPASASPSPPPLRPYRFYTSILRPIIAAPIICVGVPPSGGCVGVPPSGGYVGVPPSGGVCAIADSPHPQKPEA